MATRIKKKPKQWAEQEDEDEKVRKLVRNRYVIEQQLHRIKTYFEDETVIHDRAVLKAKLDSLNKCTDRFEQVQSEIESLVSGDKLEEQIIVREEVDDLGFWTKVQIHRREDELEGKNTGRTDNTYTRSHNGLTGINLAPFNPAIETYRNFNNRLHTYIELRHCTEDPTITIKILLNALPPEVHEKLYDIVAPEDPKTKSFAELSEILQELLDPKPSEYAQQHKFLSTLQNTNENVSDFAANLKIISAHCNFKCECERSIADTFLRAQFIRGLSDNDIRTRLLQNREKLNFKEIVEQAKVIELSTKESKLIHPSNYEPILAVSKNDSRSKNRTNKFEALKGCCFRCGDERHRANDCKFKGTECSACGKTGHLAKVCLSTDNRMSTKKNYSKNTHQWNIEDTDNEEPQEIHLISSTGSDKFMVQLKIEGKPISMELDTGAALTSISYENFKKLGSKKMLHDTHIRMKTYTGEIINPRGVCFVQIHYKSQSFMGQLYVIDAAVPPILGREWMRLFDMKVEEILSLSKPTIHLDDLLKEYDDLFKDNIGKIPNFEAHIELEDSAKPIYMKPRRVPYALKKKVELELDRLEAMGIIELKENSEWGTPIVPVVKPNGSVRICADYKSTINKCTKQINYPIPRIDDIFAQMNGGKYFCTLDLRMAYLHMPMDEESAHIQAISTHKGCFAVKRLMFGNKKSPGLWQRYMDQLLQGLEGVQCFFDDIFIQGKTLEQTTERLQLVFIRLRKANLSINKDKCKFLQNSIKYLGHIIDEQGFHASPEKSEGIINATPPKNVHELQVFLGMVNYYNKFLPNLASTLNPIYHLLKKGVPYHWTNQCQDAFEEIKQLLASDQVLVHYNDELPLIIAADASPTGLGAVISHRYPDGSERPIAFASRSLTICERKYSQIDKEATSIYWALRKFFPYCYGRKFTLVTDHKPLVSIFDPQATLPVLTATRMFHYAQFLAGFDYQIRYRSTKEHNNADFLSRFPTQKLQMNDKLDQTEIFMMNQIQKLPVTRSQIKIETTNDPQLSKILQALENGHSLVKMGMKDSEYCLQDGCIFRGERVVVPEKLQKAVLDELHSGHLGMSKMKALSRSYCYWPGLDKQIETLVNDCKSCLEVRNDPPKCHHPWEEPSGPWERIHIDFAGPFLNKSFFIVVDAFTKWVEIIPTNTTTTAWITDSLAKVFSVFGIPYVLVSDNASQFCSREFQQFLKENNVYHKTSAPYHPATNGQAERFVQTVKNKLKAMSADRGDLNHKIATILIQLRRAPNATGISAYKQMFSYNVRSKLDLLICDQEPKQSRRKSSLDATRTFHVGNRVLVRGYHPRGHKWMEGIIQAKQGNLHYQVVVEDRILKRHVDQLRRCGLRGET